MDDLISRQDAIDAVNETIAQYIPYLTIETNGIPLEIAFAIKRIPSVHPEIDEWCHDCKEFDKNNDCCPRFNRVIRDALKMERTKRRAYKMCRTLDSTQ